MNINNPTTFGSPSLTLSTSNSSGTGGALRSDDTIALFDVTAVASVGASNTTGSQAVASRRDHVHAGVGGAGTVVDDAIARFDGTGGASLQGYSSLSPTISDAGIISLTSGALKYPATAIASADANTLDDYELGTFSPIITDNDGTQGTYTRQVGHYTKIGDSLSYTIDVVVNSLGSMTGSDYCRIGGLPFVAGSDDRAFAVGYGTSLAITAGNYVSGWISGGAATGLFAVWDATTGASYMTITQLSAGGGFKIFGTYNT